MPFSQLIGNEAAKAALTRMAEHAQVPNTLLFAGQQGVGKGLFARHLAVLLMGSLHAHKIFSGNHPDVHEYHTEGKGSVHPIESMRSLIGEVGMPAFEAPLKVFILHDAHQMQPASSNALLKTLEEPTLDSYIILLTHEPEMLLPTIISRCRKIPFFPVADELIARYAITQFGKSAEEAKQIAFAAQGSVAKAVQIAANAQDTKSALLYQIFACIPNVFQNAGTGNAGASDLLPPKQTMCEHMVDGGGCKDGDDGAASTCVLKGIRYQFADRPQFLKLCTKLEEECGLNTDSEEESGSSAQHIDTVLEEIAAWYRDLHLLAERGNPSFLYHHQARALLEQAMLQKIPALEHVLEVLARCRLGIQRNMKLRVVLEELFFQLR